MPKISSITQLIEVLDYIGRNLDRGEQIDVIFMDLSEAFDKVSYAKLLDRLRGIDINKPVFVEQRRGCFQ